MTGKYNLAKFNILVADSNPHMRNLLGEILRSFGVGRVHSAEDSATALLLLKSAIDLLIVDWMLEPINGRELARTIRVSNDGTIPLVPIIMLTGHTERNRVIAARDAGINEFLAKPVSPLALFNRIVSIIENPRPFIKIDKFFGPDRRRHAGPYDGIRRRASDSSDTADPSRGEAAAPRQAPAEAAKEIAH